MPTRTSVLFVFLLSALSVSIGAQDQGKLTARELFYAGGKKPAPPAPARGATPPAKAPQAAPAPASAQSASSTASTASKTQTTTNRPSAQEPVRPVVTNASYVPIGLRYSLLQRNSASRYEEVDVDTTFRSGDGIRLTIESNDEAYLYIVNKGSSGAWSVLFPSSQIDNGNNHVQAHRRYEVPANGQFTFEAPPGEERLFLVLSREPEPDLEKLIYTLDRPGAAPNAPNTNSQPKVLTVQAINDDLIGRIRSAVIARDLVFEKVDDRTSSRQEKAAYVVNATSGRVVADLSLKHR